MNLTFRSDFQEVLVDWLTRERRSTTAEADLGAAGIGLEVLSPPERHSPFLTLAEWSDASRGGLPWRVLKLLMVLDHDPSESFWRGVLESEAERWREELRRRLDFSGRIGTLGLPLSVPASGHDGLVEIAELGPLRRSQLLDGPVPEQPLRLAYLVRPFVAWPRLADVGYSADQLQEQWEIYCQEHEVGAHLHGPLFRHFCDEALVDGRHDMLLTSAWRLEVFR